MLIVISPAKTLDYESALPAIRSTQPRLLHQSSELIERARQLSAEDLARLMKVSDKIATLNVTRFQQWHLPFTQANARPAIFAFKGDTYTGLDIGRFNKDELRAAQQRLRSLSGLYGVLRPFDLMQPYRLEMGTRLDTAHGKNLYEFWNGAITQLLVQDMRKVGTDILVNLASNEYFKAVQTAKLPGPVITPVFQDEKNGTYKVISFYAKKARGSMASWMIRNDIRTAEQLQQFDVDGYRYQRDLSTHGKPVFRRPEKA